MAALKPMRQAAVPRGAAARLCGLPPRHGAGAGGRGEEASEGRASMPGSARCGGSIGAGENENAAAAATCTSTSAQRRAPSLPRISLRPL